MTDNDPGRRALEAAAEAMLNLPHDVKDAAWEKSDFDLELVLAKAAVRAWLASVGMSSEALTTQSGFYFAARAGGKATAARWAAAIRGLEAGAPDGE